MKRRIAAGLALVWMLVLCACGGGNPSGTELSAPPASEPASERVPPGEGSPAEPPDNSAEPDEPALPAYTSEELGFTAALPEGVTPVTWEGGVTFQFDAAQGSYLSVSFVDALSVSRAVEGLRFQNDIEGEPEGILFGAEGYAGLRLDQRIGELEQTFVVCQQGKHIYLVEWALFGTAGQSAAEPLRTMLDSLRFS